MASIFFISLTSFFSPAFNVVQKTSQHELSPAILDEYTSESAELNFIFFDGGTTSGTGVRKTYPAT